MWVASNVPVLQGSLHKHLKSTLLGSGVLLKSSQQERRGLVFFLGQMQLSNVGGPSPTSRGLLGKDRLQGCQQATGPQAVGESGTSVNSCRCQAKELAHRVAQLLHTVDHFTVLLAAEANKQKPCRTPEPWRDNIKIGKPPSPLVCGKTTE